MIVIGPTLGLLATRHPLRRSWLVLAVIAAEATVWTAVLLQPGPAPLWLLVLLIVGAGRGRTWFDGRHRHLPDRQPERAASASPRA